MNEKNSCQEKEFQIIRNYMIIRLPAELDHHSAEHIRLQADRLLETQSVNTIVLDFADTGFMDSSGIGVIMGRYRMIHYTGGKVVAVRVNSRVSKILKMSGLYKIMDVYKNIPEELIPVYVKGGAL